MLRLHFSCFSSFCSMYTKTFAGGEARRRRKKTLAGKFLRGEPAVANSKGLDWHQWTFWPSSLPNMILWTFVSQLWSFRPLSSDYDFSDHRHPSSRSFRPPSPNYGPSDYFHLIQSFWLPSTIVFQKSVAQLRSFRPPWTDYDFLTSVTRRLLPFRLSSSDYGLFDLRHMSTMILPTKRTCQY